MKNFLLNNKNIIITIILFIIAFAAYKLINVQNVPVVESIDNNVVMTGRDVVDLSNNIRSAKLETTLFNKPEYLILKDFSTIIPNQPKGRVNPFGAIGSDSAGIISQTPTPTALATSTKR